MLERIAFPPCRTLTPSRRRLGGYFAFMTFFDSGGWPGNGGATGDITLCCEVTPSEILTRGPFFPCFAPFLISIYGRLGRGGKAPNTRKIVLPRSPLQHDAITKERIQTRPCHARTTVNNGTSRIQRRDHAPCFAVSSTKRCGPVLWPGLDRGAQNDDALCHADSACF